MVIIFIRTVIILVILLAVMRLMGKRQIGEMQPYEFIITLLIAEVACVPMSDVSIPLVYGITSLLAIFIMHQIISIFELFGQNFKRFLNGKPSIIIDEKGVDHRELKKNNMDVEDLIEALRGADCFSLDEVKYAILETTGKISVIKNPEKSTSEIPILIVNNGKFLKSNANLLPISVKNLKKYFEMLGTSLEKLQILTVDKNGKYYAQQKGKNFTVGKINFVEENPI